MATQQTPISNPYLAIQQIQDIYTRKNFEALKNYFDTQNQLLDFKFFEKVFTAAETGAKITHGLPYIPQDIIVTKITGAGTVTFQYGSFTTTSIVVDVSAACRIRFFAGSYSRFTSSVQAASTDLCKFYASPETAAHVSFNYTTVSTGTYTPVTTDDIEAIDASRQAITVTLPLASAFIKRQLTFIKTDTTTNTVTVQGGVGAAAREKINGFTSFILAAQFDRISLYSTGTAWVIIQCNKASTIQQFLSGSGTYTPTVGTKYIIVTAVGGGGAGAVLNANGTAASGVNTTFGVTLLVASGGTGGNAAAFGSGNGSNGGVGGSATIAAGISGVAVAGGSGQGGASGSSTNEPVAGGGGGCSPLGGGSTGSFNASSAGTAGSGAANTGGGGGGTGNVNSTAGASGGSGGGAGGYIRAIIKNLASSYAYSVGAGGTAAGAAGSGGSGIIIVEEFYG